MKDGEINCYQFSGFSTSSNNITSSSNNEIFVKGDGTVYGNYKPKNVYYLITVKNDFRFNFYPGNSFPPYISLVYNTSPVCGDIAGQLLQVNNTYAWGPLANYVPQEFYAKAGTCYEVTYQYLCQLPIGNYTIEKNWIISSQNVSYISLLTRPAGYNVTYESNDTCEFYNTIGGLFNVSSPLLITVYEKIEYGGYQNGQ
ncbi:hypothetical protein [Acidianus manzaensis]|uniref:hypothetical protein n=1 Tax=Acidianus manzaensis TaxID=282676 RepID=UPI001F335870|nr:hypothetical protein [Acidianus manzaensis]